ncbi:hypothetical protein D3C80_1935530 [compost metagenome]
MSRHYEISCGPHAGEYFRKLDHKLDFEGYTFSAVHGLRKMHLYKRLVIHISVIGLHILQTLHK